MVENLREFSFSGPVGKSSLYKILLKNAYIFSDCMYYINNMPYV